MLIGRVDSGKSLKSPSTVSEQGCRESFHSVCFYRLSTAQVKKGCVEWETTHGHERALTESLQFIHCSYFSSAPHLWLELISDRFHPHSSVDLIIFLHYDNCSPLDSSGQDRVASYTRFTACSLLLTPVERNCYAVLLPNMFRNR